VKSLLVLAALLLIFLLVLVVFIPAWLERRATTNRARRTACIAETGALDRSSQGLHRTLARYHRAQSQVYRDQAGIAVDRLADLDSHLATLNDMIGRLKCPEMFDYLLPVKHFILFPQDFRSILFDTRQLGRIRNQFQVATGSLAAAETAVAQLVAMPDRLAKERHTLTGRLDQIETIIRQERAAGIIALVDLDEDQSRVRALLGDQAAINPDAPLRELDSGALMLETATAGIAALEKNLDDMRRERTLLDERLRRVAAELDDAQAGTKAGPDAADAPPQVRPLLRRAAALLNESAADHRRRRDFAAAGRDADQAERLIAVGRDLAVADRRARHLIARDDGQSLTGPIAALRQDLDAALETVAALPGERGVDQGLVDRATALRRRAEVLIQRQNEIIAALEREAESIRGRVEQGWNESRRLIVLDADDPLARRYDRLLANDEAARRSPVALLQYREDATAFERTMNPWLARLAATEERIGRLRATLPETIDKALQVAASWRCLEEHILFIQQRAADFETARGHFHQVTRRRDAERLMDEIEAIERDVAEQLAVLQDQSARLRFLEADVDQIVTMASHDGSGLTAESPEWARRERTFQLIAHHTTQAHAATRYEDASLALSRAADLANKLAL
jgi:hypothetical protein